jgi:hypothetical protein
MDNQNILMLLQVHVPTDQARTLTFQCGMGMYKSSVIIQ